MEGRRSTQDAPPAFMVAAGFICAFALGAALPAAVAAQAQGKFWKMHQLDARLMQSSIHRADVRESTTITLRFDPLPQRGGHIRNRASQKPDFVAPFG